MKIADYLRCGAALAACCAAAAAQTMPARDLRLVEGRGELLEFNQDIQKVAVAEPKIADAVVISPHEVMVNAKGPGRTTVVIWESGSPPARFNVDVNADTTTFDLFKKQIQDSAPGGIINVSGTGETVVLTGMVKTPEEVKRAGSLASTRAKNVVNLLQSPPPPEPREILLQVKFAALDRVKLNQMGFNLFSTSNALQGVSSTEQFQAPRVSQLQTSSNGSSAVNFADLLNLFVYRPDINLGATIKALETENVLQILAEPNLIVVEGKDASFLAGGSFPFPTITTTTTGGAVAPVITVQFKPFGVKLDFTPTITPAGAIDLKVAPEVSALDFSNAVQLQGFLIPALSVRRAETEVILKDGESFAIAGLLDNRVTKEINKVPWLGSVPILGALFKSSSNQKSTDELLVVITPHFVKPLSPDEKPKLLDFPETFLPTVPQEKAVENLRKKGDGKVAEDAKKPEFVGPSGYQEPK